MRLRPTAPARPLRRGLAAALLALLASAAIAAPGDADPIGRLLVDRGEAPAPTSKAEALIAQVRDRTGAVRERVADMVLTALNFVGVRYVRGGASEESGFDCSGFTRLVFRDSLGLLLPRSADEQARAPGLVEVRREDLQPGDLVFFNTLKRTFSHVGIYVGGNRFVHAPRPGGEVRTEDMGYAYWKSRFTGARRAEALAAAAPVAAPADVAAIALH
jgi:cell wall-associated NlpC family hydrolase